MATTFPDSHEDSPRELQPRFQATLMGIDETDQLEWSSTCGLPLSSGYHMPALHTPDSAALFDYAPDGLPYNNNYNLTYSALNTGSSSPRSYTNGLVLTGSVGNMSESYPPSAYLIQPQKQQEISHLSDQVPSGRLLQIHDDFDNQCAPMVKVEDLGSYDTPGYEPDNCLQGASTPHKDPPMPSNDSDRNECGGDDAAVDKEQPYAQLIYRALMQSPGHMMILRDIYNWFKQNTDKAADKETKGWQNSIRHNLSMNGAFEKVDQPCEEAKKGFMWRLTDEAIREGVKSTTRYRSKMPNKRGHRSQHPQPQRQASGAKGGQAARRAAKLKRSHRRNEGYSHRSDPYISRSVPASEYRYSPPFGSLPSSSMPYPPSPYYNSEVDLCRPTKHDDFGSTMIGPGLDLLPTRPYSASPQQPLCTDPAYMVPCQSSEPLFYGEPSPSSSGDEPLTPDSAGGDWDMDVAMPTSTSFVFDDMAPNYMH
ncbi:hypothetical protein K469DRAFT_663344 [Zopfia rhizophila CBS 207.26]|uniref:Fork-head domain-containing protein n=1 Tax=Zopfia rhizophila CBS 207.26 TaxID=1314779 RepID=A0A6A6E8H6_9PEZI|nr:hypothetical protein K469DRAFT_663344 [Zopfia rhizophila CBS 207.26]